MRFDTVSQWLQWQEGLHPTEIDLGLDRLQATFRRLAIDFSSQIVFTIAGTNGKGSCVALLSAILKKAGYRVGTFTSPHLFTYSERIKVDDVCIGDRDLCEVFGRIDSARQNTSLTYFEFSALAALLYFKQRDCDVLVLEVGLGGRLDAVNIIDPDIAIITSIGLDHTEWLGNNRDAIAIEKAGIMRQHGQLVCGEQSIPDSLMKRVRELGVSAYYINKSYSFAEVEDRWELDVGDGEMYSLPLPTLPGKFQLRNAATAIMALHQLRNRLNIDHKHIENGLRTVKLPGRLQLLASGPDLWVDVGHNQQAAQALAADLSLRRVPGSEIHAVFAILKQKDVEAVIAAMSGVISHWHLAPLSNAIAHATQDVEKLVKKYSVLSHLDVSVSTYSDIPMAWDTAQRLARPKTDVVLGFGSFFTVSEILIFN